MVAGCQERAASASSPGKPPSPALADAWTFRSPTLTRGPTRPYFLVVVTAKRPDPNWGRRLRQLSFHCRCYVGTKLMFILTADGPVIGFCLATPS